MKRDEGEEEAELEVEARLVGFVSGSLELTNPKMAPSSSETVIRLCLGRLSERKRRRILLEEDEVEEEGGAEDVELDDVEGFALGLLVRGDAAAMVDTS